MTHQLNALAGGWIPPLWNASLQGGIVLVVVWCICRFVPRISPALKVWLWRIAWLKFLLALFWTGTIDLPLLGPSASAVAERPSPVEVRQALEPALPVTVISKPSLKLITFGFLIWVTGVLCNSVRLGYQWRQSIRLKRRSSPVADASVAELRLQLGVTRLPAIHASNAISAPLLVGILRPVIIVPRSVPEDKLRVMLAHELAHVKRRDLLWGWLHAICSTLFFFHPLLWLTRREWLLAQEMACDELALRRSSVSAVLYGNMLIDLAASAVPRPRFGTLGIFETTQNLKRRIQGMKMIGTRKSRTLMFALFTISVTGILPWRIVAQEKPAESAKRIEQLEKANASLRKEIEDLKSSAKGDQRLQLRMDLLNDRLQRDIAIAGLAVASNKMMRAQLLVDGRVESQEVLEIAKAEFQRLQMEIATRTRSIGEREAALAQADTGERNTAARTSMNDQQRDRARQLYLEEMALAQKYVDSVHKQFESGRATHDQLFRAQQQLFAVKREMAGADSNRVQLKEAVREEIAIVERLLKEAKKRVELGVAPQGEELNLQRELLKLKRELLSLD